MKFSMRNYSHFPFIVLAVASIFLLTSNPAQVSNSQARGIGEINTSQDTNYSNTKNATLKTGQSSWLNSMGRYYFVQTQPGFTTPGAGTESSPGESNSTDNSQNLAEDKVSSNGETNNVHSTGSVDKESSAPKSSTIKCEGSALCVTGEVVKVINGKTFYVNIQNKVYKVELALIGLPVQSEAAMRAATTFTRNTCLGSNVLIDQDDGQKVDSFIAQVYCSPTKNLNSMLLQTGYVQLDKSQCNSSEFSKLDWAKFYGC